MLKRSRSMYTVYVFKGIRTIPYLALETPYVSNRVAIIEGIFHAVFEP